MATFDFTSGTRPFDKVLRWNTLDDAASLLMELTGEVWTPHRILSDVLDMYRAPQGKTPPPTCLRCAPPHGTKFARYKWDAENGTPSNPFVYVCAAPYQTVALYPAQVDDLLKAGEATISVAERPEDDYGRPGEYVFIEPPEQALTIALSSVGMSAAGLREFAARVVAERPEISNALPPVEPRRALEEGTARPPATICRIGTRVTPLSAEIEEAKRRAPRSNSPESVWGALTKMAEEGWGILVGYSSDGVQYRGKRYEASQVPDVFTKKNLRDRMSGAKRRAK
ncbi:hypothetical protein [Burkholderia ubonensis]|uniref:hypothetical protein n=1 Tax=Burkholderia ubonensis TaxID=101571 RepID=UPI000F569811|nr:hypothetical protein [Burkholderia ubonensis]